MSKKNEKIELSTADCEVMRDATQYFYTDVFEFGAPCPGRLRSAAGSAAAKLANLKFTDGLDGELPLTPNEVAAVASALSYIMDGLDNDLLSFEDLPHNLCDHSCLASLYNVLTSFLKAD